MSGKAIGENFSSRSYKHIFRLWPSAKWHICGFCPKWRKDVGQAALEGLGMVLSDGSGWQGSCLLSQRIAALLFGMFLVLEDFMWNPGMCQEGVPGKGSKT